MWRPGHSLALGLSCCELLAMPCPTATQISSFDAGATLPGFPTPCCRVSRPRSTSVLLAYTGVTDSQQFSNLAALHWHLWRTESVLSYDNPELALLTPPDGLAVATWRAASPYDLARATCRSLYLLTGLAKPTGTVTFARASGARRQGLDNIERIRRMYPRERKSSAKPVRGHCRACGHALRDAASLRRGYGPDCWERVADHRRVGIAQAPDLPAHYWAGALPISGLRRRIGDGLRRLVAQDPY